MATKNNFRNQFLLSVLMIMIGAGATYFITTQVIPQKGIDKKLTNEYAKVKKINDLYVFIESFPADSESYTTIDIIEGDNLIEIWNSLGIGKDKFGEVLLNIINKGQENLVFYEKLSKMTIRVKNQYKDVSGIIFTDRMNKCQVIKFKSN